MRRRVISVILLLTLVAPAEGPITASQTSMDVLAAGDYQLALGEYQLALDQYFQLLQADTTSPLTARALLATGRCYVGMGQPATAFDAFQQILRRFPRGPEAELARNANAILDRLYFRTPQYVFERELQKADVSISAVVELLIDDRGRVTLAHYGGWVQWLRDGTVVDFDKAKPIDLNVTAAALHPNGSIGYARKTDVSFDQKRTSPWAPAVPRGESLTDSKQANIVSLVSTLRGEWVFADEASHAIYQQIPSTNGTQLFANFSADKLAVDYIGKIAALDVSEKTISLFNRLKMVLHSINDKARPETTYSFRSARDLAFDPLGNLYVLDTAGRKIHVFDPKLKASVSFEVPRNPSGGTPEPVAIAIDQAGRLYLYDEGRKRICVYK